MLKIDKYEGSRKTETLAGISFNEHILTTTGLMKIARSFAGEQEKIDFDNDRKLMDMGLGIFLIEYDNKSSRDNDMEVMQTFDVKEKAFHSPAYAGNFEFKDKYYIIVEAILGLKGETNDYLYKGLIVNPSKYLQFKSEQKLPETRASKLYDTLLSQSNTGDSQELIEKLKYSSQSKSISECINESFSLPFSTDNRFFIRLKDFMDSLEKTKNNNEHWKSYLVGSKNDFRMYFLNDRKEYIDLIREHLAQNNISDKEKQNEEIKKIFEKFFKLLQEKITYEA